MSGVDHIVRVGVMGWCALACAAGCGDSAGEPPPSQGAQLAPGANPFESGAALSVPVTSERTTYVSLAGPSVVDVGDPRTDGGWDLAFTGAEVRTNSGISGSGAGGAFGPLDAATFAGDRAPAVPKLSPDKAGGAFAAWYAYDGASHALWSRYPVVGVRTAGRLFKVQVLSYYGKRDGAVLPALFQVRYAELGGSGGGMTNVENLDATAGGVAAKPDAPSECLNLVTGARPMHTESEARASDDWHLCFRREAITVNGGVGGPGDVTAARLGSPPDPDDDDLGPVKAKTADSERAAFDAVTAASFDGCAFRGDRVVSAFDEGWLTDGADPVAPTASTWLVRSAAGDRTYFVAAERFVGATSRSPGTVALRVKPVPR